MRRAQYFNQFFFLSFQNLITVTKDVREKLRNHKDFSKTVVQ